MLLKPGLCSFDSIGLLFNDRNFAVVKGLVDLAGQVKTGPLVLLLLDQGALFFLEFEELVRNGEEVAKGLPGVEAGRETYPLDEIASLPLHNFEVQDGLAFVLPDFRVLPHDLIHAITIHKYLEGHFYTPIYIWTQLINRIKCYHNSLLKSVRTLAVPQLLLGIAPLPLVIVKRADLRLTSPSLDHFAQEGQPPPESELLHQESPCIFAACIEKKVPSLKPKK